MHGPATTLLSPIRPTAMDKKMLEGIFNERLELNKNAFKARIRDNLQMDVVFVF